MYKIAVMGDRQSILGYGALGLDTFFTKDKEDAAKTLHSLAKRGYAVIYITEAAAALIPEEIERYNFSPLPAVILIPGASGNTGQGLRALHESVEKAVGSDIL